MIARNIVLMLIAILGALGIVYLTIEYIRLENEPMDQILFSWQINEDTSDNPVETSLQNNENSETNNENDFKISSDSFVNLGEIPAKFTCDGDNINPSIKIENVPYGTESLVLLVEDPDAKSKTWVHWILYDIDPGIGLIAEDFVPTSEKAGMNDFGQNKYGALCPPVGQPHRYIFNLYALSKTLDDQDAGLIKEALIELMNENIIDQATMMGTYKKLSE